jgi:hypothetical protein
MVEHVRSRRRPGTIVSTGGTVSPITRKAALTIGGLVAAATLAAGTGVAAAADGSTATTHPKAAAAVQHRLDRRVARQTRVTNRLDKAAGRLDTRSGKLTTKVDALADGAAKTDALAKLADLATQTAAVKATDARVLTALKAIDVTDVSATRTTLTSDLSLLKTSRADIALARKDVIAIALDLEH